jgi:uroporphyrinogen III methyltransferase/synthase
LEACVCGADGRVVLRTEASGPADLAEALGREAAAALRAQGADALVTQGAETAAVDAPRLQGRRIVVTRAASGAGRLEDLFRAEGAEVFAFPTIAIAHRAEAPLPGPAGAYAWVVFTSANAVEALDALLRAAGRALTEFSDTPVCAIGPGTAAALSRLGLPVRLTPDEAVAEAVAEALLRIGHLDGARVLLPCGNLSRPVLSEALRGAGAVVEATVVYDTVPVQHDAAACDALVDFAPEVVAFTSGSSVDGFVAGLSEARRARVFATAQAAAIGPITAAAARRHGITPGIEADRHDLPGLVEAVAAALAG